MLSWIFKGRETKLIETLCWRHDCSFWHQISVPICFFPELKEPKFRAQGTEISVMDLVACALTAEPFLNFYTQNNKQVGWKNNKTWITSFFLWWRLIKLILIKLLAQDTIEYLSFLINYSFEDGGFPEQSARAKVFFFRNLDRIWMKITTVQLHYISYGAKFLKEPGLTAFLFTLNTFSLFYKKLFGFCNKHSIVVELTGNEIPIQ